MATRLKSSAVENPQSVSLGLTPHNVGATVVLGLTAAAVLARFPLSRADHEARLQDLAEAAMSSTLPGGEAEPPAGLALRNSP